MLSTILLIQFYIPISASFPTAVPIAEPIDVANLVTAAVAIGVATAVAAVKTSFCVVVVGSVSDGVDVADMSFRFSNQLRTLNQIVH